MTAHQRGMYCHQVGSNFRPRKDRCSWMSMATLLEQTAGVGSGRLLLMSTGARPRNQQCCNIADLQATQS